MRYSKHLFLVLLLSSLSAHAAEKYWIDNDAGFDTDDQLANVLSRYYFNNDIAGVSTTLYDPETKARINRLTFSELGLDVPIYPGEGYAPNLPKNQLSDSLKRYPEWPVKQFKDPQTINQGRRGESKPGQFGLYCSGTSH
ncbi:MAG: hypothetical protein A2603_02950 [Bdellovibrionales bacterium RIFOXYD1_FULL_55_31]|nr:MAG: hypothetical protein A2603_02950 [Bdellovibrionales bacterium RIFOXYD1_FULL_55_31]